MTKVNEKFIEAMQKRLDEKEDIFTEKLNYKNMRTETLWFRLMEQTKLPDVILAPDSKLIHKCFKTATIEEIIDIANFCWMLWEKLEE